MPAPIPLVRCSREHSNGRSSMNGPASFLLTPRSKSTSVYVFCKLAEWVDRRWKITLIFEHFVADFDINSTTPPATSHTDALDLHCLRESVLLDDSSVITVALASLCTCVPGATTYLIASHSVVDTVTTWLKRT